MSRYHAAVLAVPQSAVSGRAAAHVHRLSKFGATAPEVSTILQVGHQVDGVSIRRRSDLLDRHLTAIDRLAVTTLPRTVLDLAAYLSWIDLAQVVDEVVDHRKISIRVLFDEFDRVARRGRNGTLALRMVLEPRLIDSTLGTSELERRGRDFLERYGFPDPAVEFKPPWAGPAVARVDLAYPNHKIVIELDGRKWHDRSDRFEHDRLRDQLAMARGWIVVRITWRQLRDDPDGVAARLTAILQSRSVA
jgi:hypothetical protein